MNQNLPVLNHQTSEDELAKAIQASLDQAQEENIPLSYAEDE